MFRQSGLPKRLSAPKNVRCEVYGLHVECGPITRPNDSREPWVTILWMDKILHHLTKLCFLMIPL